MKSQAENPSGLHVRYQIKKLVESKTFKNTYVPVDPDPGAEYFVLRLDEGGDIEHVKASRLAIATYAEAISSHLPELSKNLLEHYPVI